MRQITRLFWLLGLSVQVMLAHAAPTQVEGLKFSSVNSGRLVFNLNAVPHYRYFMLNNPSRLVVDFIDTALARGMDQPPANHALAVGVRSAVRNKTNLRVVVELNAEAEPKVAAINKGKGLQLQFDLKATSSPKAVKVAKKSNTKKANNKPAVKSPVQAKKVAQKSSSKASKANGRDIIIAIDAGHGGKDKGAQGGNGTYEKDVVLAIAKRLQSAVNRQAGMKAVMVRDGDYFVKLNKRVNIAREAKADLFVSIHADAFEDASAHGASVYTLANKGASSQLAQYLADSENAADGSAGVGDETLASVLMDLSQNASKEASQHIGNKVLKSVDTVSHLHRKSVQKAGFVVLKSPVPSILVETAFISNPQEEKRLKTRSYQDQMAKAVFNGIVAHFKQYAPANTKFAQLQKSGKMATKVASSNKSSKQKLAKANVDTADKVVSNHSAQTKHVISSGETLSGIAQQYGVSMREIRNVNGMDDGNLKAGQVLQIPRSS